MFRLLLLVAASAEKGDVLRGILKAYFPIPDMAFSPSASFSCRFLLRKLAFRGVSKLFFLSSFL